VPALRGDLANIPHPPHRHACRLPEIL